MKRCSGSGLALLLAMMVEFPVGTARYQSPVMICCQSLVINFLNQTHTRQTLLGRELRVK